MKVSVKQVYTSVACNRTPEIVDWNSEGPICFGATNSVVVYDTVKISLFNASLLVKYIPNKSKYYIGCNRDPVTLCKYFYIFWYLCTFLFRLYVNNTTSLLNVLIHRTFEVFFFNLRTSLLSVEQPPLLSILYL